MVVTLYVLEKFRALQRHHRAIILVVGPESPEGKDMTGCGRGGPVIFPHPDDDNAGRLLDDVGRTNMNDDDNNDTPRPL